MTYNAESLLEGLLCLQLELLDLGLLFSHLSHLYGEVSLRQGTALHHEGSLWLSHEHIVESGGSQEHLRSLDGEETAHRCCEGVLSSCHLEGSGWLQLSDQGERLLAELPLGGCS